VDILYSEVGVLLRGYKERENERRIRVKLTGLCEAKKRRKH